MNGACPTRPIVSMNFSELSRRSARYVSITRRIAGATSSLLAFIQFAIAAVSGLLVGLSYMAMKNHYGTTESYNNAVFFGVDDDFGGFMISAGLRF